MKIENPVFCIHMPLRKICDKALEYGPRLSRMNTNSFINEYEKKRVVNKIKYESYLY